ncbi:MAG TPA: biotin/lipoyl-containing protein [Candidatus Limnocylindrales bacterium]|nr:biotin/lipoyl-containing protein [Candidatus Limnocylindrales bacterium]
MPDAGPQRERSTADRSDAARRADHAGIARLAEDLLPALLAKLGSTDLGELEVREGDWHVRLRRPFGVGPGEGRRSTDRPSRTQPGHEGHGHGRAAPEGRGSRGSASGSGGGGGGGATGVTAGTGAASASTNGTGAPRGGSAAGAAAGRGADGADRSRSIATSPAVGIFEPGPRAASGTRVRAGDSLGIVNVIGVPQDVLSPADGIVGSTLVESGMAVEYGQELIRIELATPAEAR